MRNGRPAAAFFETKSHGDRPMPALALALALILSLALAGCVSGGSSRGYENTPSGGLVPGQQGY